MDTSAVWRRYQGRRPAVRRAFWSPQSPIADIPLGGRLVVALPQPALVRWHRDGRSDVEIATEDTGLGFYAAELDTSDFVTGRPIDFSWNGRDGDGAASEGVIVGVRAAEAEP